jgi:hypothetical protein
MSASNIAAVSVTACDVGFMILTMCVHIDMCT